MAYVYICDKCREGDHARCEKSRGRDTGTGICICSHKPKKGKFEQAVWDRDK